ncbi:Aminodeoxychorismate lyase [hydrothermal vent metagenome]|uniref:aminodeoxychorismate lyase n=1 Tax=hydrothermal vent metagenome TaxID=652676 RepID=A0A3B1DIA0_9ZZZZ
MYVYTNGEYVRESGARVSVFDRGFLYGDGLFETMRAYKGHIFRLDQHLQRLFKGLEVLRIKKAWTGNALTHVLYRLLDLNKLKDAYIRLTISRGVGGRGIDITGCDSPSIVIAAREFLPHPEIMYRDGVRACISEERMNCRNPIDSGVKSLNFLNNILVRTEASDRGFFEAIMLNHEGYLAEGTVSNLFLVTKGVLYTPSAEAGILNGITRQVVLEIAEEKGIMVEEGLFGTRKIYEAEEVFLTNSLIEIMPVSELDGRMYVRGRITEGLMNAYKERVNEEILAG